jgi:hypothetical protein
LGPGMRFFERASWHKKTNSATGLLEFRCTKNINSGIKFGVF